MLARTVLVVFLGAIAGVLPVLAQSAATKYGTRAPMTCKEVVLPKGPPSPAQAARLVQCFSEADFGRSIYLMADVKVELGGPRPIVVYDYKFAKDADPHAPVYPIRGSFTEVSCKQQFDYSPFKGKNCSITPILEDTGLCWLTTFGDWRCGFGGDHLRQGETLDNQPPPAALAR